MALKKAAVGVWTILLILLVTIVDMGRAVPARFYRPREPEVMIHPIRLWYQTENPLPDLTHVLGGTAGIAPLKDIRRNRRYIGHSVSARGVEAYFKSDPVPLKRALYGCLSDALSSRGVEVVSSANWDGTVEMLKDMEVDSIIQVDIRRFWTEGRSWGRNPILDTSIYLSVRVAVKSEKSVYTRNLYMIKEGSFRELTPADVEQAFNRALRELLDDFLSNPYDPLS
jgi:hypothetical protein